MVTIPQLAAADQIIHTQYGAENSQSGADAGADAGFSQALAQAGGLDAAPVAGVLAPDASADLLRDELRRMSITAGASGTPLPGGFGVMQNQGLEDAVYAAMSSGDVSDANIAMLMLVMLMSTSEGGDFSMLMPLMTTLLGQFESEKGALRDTVMNSNRDPYVLDMIDMQLFGATVPEISLTGRAVIPVEAWRPTTPAITSSVVNRSPELYRAVVAQHDVENAERYRPFRNGNTYCNIFMWDVTRAMGAEIPHYVDPDTGTPRYYPDTKGARGQTAFRIDNWLREHGPLYGWREVDARAAQMHANQGKPAVTTAGTIDHVQVVVPSRDGGYDPVKGVTIAQAGKIVSNYMHITDIYSKNAMNNNVRYFVHD